MLRFEPHVSIVMTLGELSPADPRALRCRRELEELKGPAELLVVAAATHLREKGNQEGARSCLWGSSGELSEQREVGAKRATRHYLWFVDPQEWVEDRRKEKLLGSWRGLGSLLEEEPLAAASCRVRWLPQQPLERVHGALPAVAVGALVSTPGYSDSPAGWDSAPRELALGSLFNLLHSLQAASSSWKPFWAVREPLGYLDPRWRSFPRLRQSEGPHRERAYLAYHELLGRFGSAILIDERFPQLRPRDLEEAASALGRSATSGFALGPTREGGVFLIAGRREIPWKAWGEWDAQAGFEALRRRLAAEAVAGGPVVVLSPLSADPRAIARDLAAGLRDQAYPEAQSRSLEGMIHCITLNCVPPLSLKCGFD